MGLQPFKKPTKLCRSTSPTPLEFPISKTNHITLPLPRGAPFAEPQASAPSLPMLLCPKSMFVSVSLTFNASANACGQSDGKPEDLRRNLQNHMQCYIVAPFNASDTSEEAQRKAQENVNYSGSLSVPSLFHLTSILHPSHFQDLESSTCPTSAQHLLCLPTLDHHPSSLHLGPEPPLAEHQACAQTFAPSMPKRLVTKLMFVRDLLTFNASARACGQSDGKPEDLRRNLQNHMQCYIVAPFNASDTSEEAQRKAQEKVNYSGSVSVPSLFHLTSILDPSHLQDLESSTCPTSAQHLL